MKIFKIVLVTLTIGAIVFLSLSCTRSNSATATPVTQQVTVGRGTISNSVVGTGNLALATKKDVAFETAGTVDEILVETSESVKKRAGAGQAGPNCQRRPGENVTEGPGYG